MSQEHKSKLGKIRQPRNILILAVVACVVLLIALYNMQPKRSATAYCKVYAEEKARLAKLPGDTYPTELFNDYLSDAGEIATSIGKLEKVAPNEIRPDVATLKSFYEKLDKDPSQLLSISVTAKPVDHNIASWTGAHCK